MGFIALLLIGASLLFPLLWKFSAKFRYLFKIISFYLISLLTGLIISIICVPWPRNVENFKLVRIVFLCLNSVFSIEAEVRGRHHLKSDKPLVIVCNHQSSLDQLVMMHAFPARCTPMAKRSLMYAGPFGLAAWLCGVVFVDRFNRNKALNSLSGAVERIHSENIKVWVFPEGTRYHEVGMLPFKKGAFHMAVQAQVPIVPVVVASYDPWYNKNKWRFENGGKMLIEALPPIDVTGYSADNVNDLIDYTRDLMLEKYAQNNSVARRMFEESRKGKLE